MQERVDRKRIAARMEQRRRAAMGMTLKSGKNSGKSMGMANCGKREV